MRYRILIAIAVILAAPLAAAQSAPFDEKITAAKSAMMANPATALDAAEDARALAGADAVKIATADWLRGEALNRLNRAPEATKILESALQSVKATAPEAKLHGDLLMARAAAGAAQGDYATALASFQTAHGVFAKLKLARNEAMALQQIGAIYSDARDFPRAILYFKRAGEAYSGDAPVDLARLNNIANAQRQSGDFVAAEAGFREALKIAEAMKSPMLRARILSNIASVQIAQGKAKEAEATLSAGLVLTDRSWRPFLLGVQAQAAFARGDVERAARLIEQTFAGQDLSKTTTTFREFHASAFRIYQTRGQPSLALRHLEAFKRLDDEARDVAASANTALLGAQFDFANQELQISRLRENALREDARRQSIMFFAILAIIGIILCAGALAFLAMRRSRNQVHAANAQLNTTNSALEKALKAKSDFLAMTSHEIRTPLNGILGMTQVLLSDKTLPAPMAERVQIVHGAGEAMRAIVDDILDVAKIETGEVVIKPETFALAPMVEGVSQLWRHNAEIKGLEWRLDLTDCPKKIHADEQRLRQILFNLMSNAVKFTEAGEVRVVVSGMDDVLVVSIADTGIGIPEDQHQRIFEPFTQVDASKSRKYGGTGLGLSICRTFAHAMGGSVTVSSKTDAGSTFTLRLPLGVAAETANPNDEKPVDVVALTANPLHICLLEAFAAECTISIRVFAAYDDLIAALAQITPSRIFLEADALAGCAGDVVGALMHIKNEAPNCQLLIRLGDRTDLDPALLRLAGVDRILEGDFDAEAALLAINEAPAQATAA
jgi:signal transduction histidine kinase